jgi:hypothetical protein
MINAKTFNDFTFLFKIPLPGDWKNSPTFCWCVNSMWGRKANFITIACQVQLIFMLEITLPGK